MNFNERATNLLDMPVSPLTWDGIIKECQRLEREFSYIPSGVKWALDYKRFQVEQARGNAGHALRYLKEAIATSPYNADILQDYKQLVGKTSDLHDLVLVISSKINEAKALALAAQFDAAGVQYMIVSGSGTPAIAHARALQVDVPDNAESTPQIVIAALTWVYENIGSNVGVLKVSDEMGLVDGATLKHSLSELHHADAYAGVPSGGLEHDRCFHWGLCQSQELNRRIYGRPVVSTWAGSGALYLGPGPLEKLVTSLIRFPGLFEGEYYDDKLIGDVLVFESVTLTPRAAYTDFGLSIGGVPAAVPPSKLSLHQAPAALTAAVPAAAPTPAPAKPSLTLKVQGAGTAAPAAAENQLLYLHLGCGTMNFPGFVNIDMGTSGADVNLDLTQPLPWADRTVKGIFSEHFIEHVTQAQGLRLLMECRRVLAPGGIVRMATPDLADTVNHYNDNYVHPDWANYGMAWTENRCERMNIAMRWWGHQWVYDEEELTRVGKLVGLNLKGRFKIGESSDPMLCNREYRDSSTLILEFEKPQRQIAREAQPLVSVVIPAYNPRYFAQSLESALNQTYRNLEIIICDDSSEDRILDIVRKYQETDSRIRYVRNTDRGEIPGRNNHILCFNEAQGEFIKFLNDDDLLAPDCVRRLLDCFVDNPDLVLATSKRQRIDAQGNHLDDIPATRSPFSHDTLINGLQLGQALVRSKINFIGEPTTALFRKSELIDVEPDFGSVDKWPVVGMFDIAVWLNLLVRGDAVYIVEPLSYFRIHGEQAQVVYADQCHDGARKAWEVIENAWSRLGFLN
jgi:predicted SAM-dependent methyltransferase